MKGITMKRITAIILTLLLPVVIVTGCNPSDGPGTDKLNIVCTIFPQYDWVSQILGDHAEKAEITLLLNSSIDLHSYQPSVDDIMKISTCDLFIYVGGESDNWVDNALKQASNREMITINLLETLGNKAKAEEIVEGMEDTEVDYDEHVWLSLQNAQIFCEVITEALSMLDPESANDYQTNLGTYNEQLVALNDQYQEMADTAGTKTLLFGDRFPFRYLVDDYELSYFAAFLGCSAETEASFETVVFLANKMDEINLHTVMVTESADQSIAKTIVNNTAGKNQQILVLDSLQGTTLREADNGASYLSIMENNLMVLREALK
ncbi:MAG: metal ABC transporter substrate-binding protein [Peptococcaceae bacterium]|nr:metal ABC transporter substrate-binding protein [Peptococcaceae bacterium]